MGVQGLWRLIEPSGKPVPLETLENKVLAVDISIWLHQAVKGFQDSKGATIPNAHLLGIFHRVCKLLYYRIKPVFVFDGGVPVLKRQTIAKRNQLKSKNSNDANQLQKQLLKSLLKHSAINAVLTDKAKAALEHDIQKANQSNRDTRGDMFQLPPVETESVDVESDGETSSSDDDHSHLMRQWDLYTIDEKSAHFKSLPINIRHEILSDLKDTRKQSSWGRIHELPTQSDDFSGYQMKRLLKRYSVQTALEETEKEMGGCTLSLGELEKLLINHGVISSTSIVSRRIASDEDKRYIYIRNLKEAIEKAGDNTNEAETVENDMKQHEVSNAHFSNEELSNSECTSSKSKADIEFESELQQAIQLSLQNVDNEPKNSCPEYEAVETKKFFMQNIKANLKDAIVEKLTLDGDEACLKQMSELPLRNKSKEDLCLESSENNFKNVDTLHNSDQGKSDLGKCETDLNQQTKSSLNNKVGNIHDFTNLEGITPKNVSDSKKLESNNYENDVQEEVKLSLKEQHSKLKIPVIENSEKKLIGETSSYTSKSKADEEFERDLQVAIKLSLETEATGISNDAFTTSGIFEVDETHCSDSSDDETNSELTDKVMASAKSYMTEYSNLTPAEILKIIGCQSGIPKSKGNGDNIENDGKSLSNFATNKNKVNLKKLLNKPSLSEGKSSLKDDNIEEFAKVSKDGASGWFETAPSPLISRNALETNSVELMSNSDSEDDFLEVETPTIDLNKQDTNAKKGECMEITIEKVSTLEDDLFSDIFGEKSANDKTQLESGDKPSEAISNTIDNCAEPRQNRINIIQNVVLSSNPEERTKSDSVKESELLKDILKSSKASGSTKSKLTTLDLKKLRTNLAKEASELMTEKSTKERLAANITDQMCQEAQELLQLFGVPYIIAPMEAEAQCAFLDEINLTDGTITDDSDIWLFGGKTVYKNFFNQSKLVMEFQANDIQHSFKLSRNEMILLALLVGSDYTTGIQGIGPVTALEILAAFPPPKDQLTLGHIHLLSGLREFRRWFNHNTNKSLKPTKMALRNKLRNIEISEQFPSLQVVQAYLEPTVETSDEQFSWQKPDMASLMEFARHKFGWSQMKSEEILKPVLRRLEDTAIQTKITNYFKTKHKIVGDLPQDKLSKRVKKALKNIGDRDSESIEESVEVEKNKVKKGRTRKQAKNVEKEQDLPTIREIKRNPRKRKSKTPEKELDPATIDEDIKQLQQTKKLSRNKIKEMKIALNEMLLKAEKASANEEGGPSTSVSMGTRLHRKETIPQKEKEKADVLQKRLRAIEVLRKSKQGPGYIKKRQRNVRQPKEDAELSENSDS